jgi:hypothetical protein
MMLTMSMSVLIYATSQENDRSYAKIRRTPGEWDYVTESGWVE